eukprot:6316987-Amphidinium_carterae.2
MRIIPRWKGYPAGKEDHHLRKTFISSPDKLLASHFCYVSLQPSSKSLAMDRCGDKLGQRLHHARLASVASVCFIRLAVAR